MARTKRNSRLENRTNRLMLSIGDAFISVHYPTISQPLTADVRSEYRDGLMALVANFLPHIAVVEDINLYLERIAGEERGFSRALLYSEVSLAQSNLFGSSLRVLLSDWIPPEGSKTFPLVRTSVWNENILIDQIPLHVNDIDAFALTAEDDPVIPPNVKNAPVLEVLAKAREFSKSK